MYCGTSYDKFTYCKLLWIKASAKCKMYVCVCVCVCVFSLAPSLAVIYCFVYYLWIGHNYCYAYLAGFTALFLLPGKIISYEDKDGPMDGQIDKQTDLRLI